jgi:prolyl oligopeptidase
LLVTNQNAPNSKVVAFDTVRKAWSEVISEKPEPLLSATAAGGRLFVRYSKDATSRVYVYSMRGRLENEVQLPGPGLALGFGGEAQTTVTFYSFTSMKDPLSIYRYDIAARRSELFHSPKIPGYRPEDYETKQIFYTSKDGTRVPMFLVHRKGLQMDGTNPALLSGYGGFNISCSPAFVTPRLALLEQGMVFALACLRGGGEYGQAWHEAGMRNQKQNVFDDFIAAGEWLIRNKYTSSAKLAANGTSNGGLLVGAVINQRPELFRVAIPQAGVMDMLRYQKFTIGWNWSAEYGSADHAQEFSTLRGYSPIHNIRKGVGYPSVLVTTADHDDRVVPAHSFKYAAALQAAVGGQARPALIRIETDSGHGASSTGKLISIQSDVYAFLFAELGMAPKYP